MKLNIPIEVVFDDLNSMIDELGKLQKYKFGEGDDMTLVDVADVADILARHVKAREAKRGTHWIPCSERLPNEDEEVLVTSNYGILIALWRKTWDNKICWFETVESKTLHKVTAWMPLPKPYGGESE